MAANREGHEFHSSQLGSMIEAASAAAVRSFKIKSVIPCLILALALSIFTRRGPTPAHRLVSCSAAETRGGELPVAHGLPAPCSLPSLPRIVVILRQWLLSGREADQLGG